MTAVSLKQFGLGGGIISAQLRGHSDQQKYSTGIQDAANFIVTREATMENRSGTVFVDNAGTAAYPRRLVKFVISQALAYVLWIDSATASFFVYRNEAPVNLASQTIPAWSNVTAYAQGTIVTNAGAYYYALTAVPMGTALNNTAYWFMMVGTTLQIPLPVTATVLRQSGVLQTMQYAQLNDLMVLANQAFAPIVITYSGVTNWVVNLFAPYVPTAAPTITAILPNPSNYVPPELPPANVHLTSSSSSPPLTYSYIVATVTSAPAQSAGSPATTPMVGVPSVASPNVLSWTAAAGAAGYAVFRASSQQSGWVQVQLLGAVTTWSDDGSAIPNPASLAPTSATGALLYTYVMTSIDQATGIESLPSAPVSVQSSNPGQPAAPIIVFFTGVAGAASYNIYRSISAGGGSDPVYGYIGNASATPGSNSFLDIGVTPDSAIQPPTQIVDPGQNAGGMLLFNSTGNYPAVVGTYQQRLLFANTVNQPQTFWGSRTGAWYAWTQSTPLVSDDAGQWTLAGRQVQPINALVDIGQLIIHTLSGEYVVKGDQTSTLTPTTAGIVQQGYAGSQLIQPVSIGNTDLFCQARGSILRDLQFTIQTYNYSGKDCTIFAPDLFQGRTIVAMDWQQVPHSIVWIVLDNGTLLSFTYIKEHEIWAWCRHNTYDGFFDGVVVIPEAGEDAVYLSVQRLFGGTPYRYLERLANRDFASIDDAVFVDSAQVYDGRNSSQASPFPLDSVTLTGSGWTPTNSLTLTLSNAANPLHFVSGDVGNAIVLQQVTTGVTFDANNNVIPIGTVTDSVTCQIIAYTSATVVTVLPGKNVPAWAQAQPVLTWGKAVHRFQLTNLLLMPVAGIGDGNVIPASVTDSQGYFTTQTNYLRVVAGLPIVAALQTLSIENSQGETLMNKNKRVSEVTIYFYKSRGGMYGQAFNSLSPWVQRGLIETPGMTWEQWNQGVNLYTGPARIPIGGNWQNAGQLCLVQEDPLPLGISAIVVTAMIGK